MRQLKGWVKGASHGGDMGRISKLGHVHDMRQMLLIVAREGGARGEKQIHGICGGEVGQK